MTHTDLPNKQLTEYDSVKTSYNDTFRIALPQILSLDRPQITDQILAWNTKDRKKLNTPEHIMKKGPFRLSHVCHIASVP